jgi:hypothetical protein
MVTAAKTNGKADNLDIPASLKRRERLRNRDSETQHLSAE